MAKKTTTKTTENVFPLNNGWTEMPEGWTPVFAHYRYSSKEQDRSIEGQQNDLRPWAFDKKLWITKEFIEEGISGLDEEVRPVFQEEMEAVRAITAFERGLAPKPDLYAKGLIAWKSCRFSRADSARQLIPDVLAPAKMFVWTLKESRFDFSKMEGRIMWTVLAELNHAYSLGLSQTVSRGRLAKLAAGEWAHGSIPYGYDVKYVMPDGREVFYRRGEKRGRRPREWKMFLVINEGEAAIVVRIHDEFVVQGRFLQSIADGLNLDDIPTSKGGEQWNHGILHSILGNMAYAGFVYTNLRGKPKNPQKRGKPRKERLTRLNDGKPAMFKGQHEGFIDESVVRQAAAKLAANSTEHAEKQQRRGKVEATLARVVRCGVCRHVMHPYEGPNGVYYKCVSRRKKMSDGTTITMEKPCPQWRVDEVALLPLVINKLRDMLARETLRLSTMPTERPDVNEKRTERLKARLDKAAAAYKNSVKKWAGSDDDDTVIKEALAEAMNELRQDMEAAKAEYEAAVAPSAEAVKVAERVEKLRERLICLSPKIFDFGPPMHVVKDGKLTNNPHYGRPRKPAVPPVMTSGEELSKFLQSIHFEVVIFPRKKNRGHYTVDGGRITATIAGDVPTLPERKGRAVSTKPVGVRSAMGEAALAFQEEAKARGMTVKELQREYDRCERKSRRDGSGPDNGPGGTKANTEYVCNDSASRSGTRWSTPCRAT